MGEGTRFWILPHPDDELLCLPLLLENKKANVLLYLAARDNDWRFRESKKAVNYINNQGFNVTIFPNTSPSKDGSLPLELNSKLINSLELQIVEANTVELIAPAYEGGHQDHDAAFIIAFILSKRLKLPLTCFNTYCASVSAFPGFRAMQPFKDGRKIYFDSIKVTRTFLRLILLYPSQWKTWIGLGPFVAFKYLKGVSRSTLQVDTLPNLLLPHYLYQNRRRAQVTEVLDRFESALQNFLPMDGAQK